MTEPMSPLLQSLLAAVEAAPQDSTLRLHVAEQLLAAGRPADALAHVGQVLAARPADGEALGLLQRATAALAGGAAAGGAPAAGGDPAPGGGPAATGAGADGGVPSGEFDWSAAEEQLGVDVPPPFVDGTPVEVPAAGITLADVAGMEHVKQRLELAFLTPMRNPELQRMYGATMRGGLLLYGPPGCGKTFVARALAGELGAKFLAVSLSDVLDMYVGNSEKNVHELFEAARRNAPCVVFLDEVDAIGQKRSQLARGGAAQRGTVNTLLTELDGVGSQNDGVFVLAATNHPWDVDTALKRPGRLDRSVLVLPPDLEARAAILRNALRDKPIAGIDVAAIAKRTDGWSGADLMSLADRAAQLGLADSVRSGTARPIGQRDLEAALGMGGSSIGPWYETAKSVAQFANSSGEYDELMEHLRKRKLV